VFELFKFFSFFEVLQQVGVGVKDEGAQAALVVFTVGGWRL